MSKKYLTILSVLIVTSNVAFADVQSPIYTDDIGRAHFLGRGGYSTVRQMNMQGIEAGAINDATIKYSQKKQEVKNDVDDAVNYVQTTEKNITDVIKERTDVPVSSSKKATFSSEQRKMDASAPYGYGMTNIDAGVNESKTIYKDNLGRLHFFGKANLIKE